MFTANSMNCLTEALGLALPGNGSIVATHADRRDLFVKAGHLIVDLARRYYEKDDKRALPREIASFKAFENAMTLDIAMGGSTNTVLHLLAAAYEGEVPFTMADIDRLSRKVPVLCKVAPSVADVHLEDVHRAGGVMAILGELDRGGLLTTDLPVVHSETLATALASWDVEQTSNEKVTGFYRAAPGGVPTQTAFSQKQRYDELDTDRAKGAIRDVAHAFSRDGGLAVLSGNLALDGCIVKTAGVDESILKFSGPARVYESQDAAVAGILGNKVKAGDVVVVVYEGPKGGPGMQEMLYPTSYLKSKGLGKVCALITDGRFSGGSSGLSIGHISPEAAEGGLIGLVKDGDMIELDIPNRSILLAVDEAELSAPSYRDARARYKSMEACQARSQGVDGTQGLCRADDQCGPWRGSHRRGLNGNLRRARGRQRQHRIDRLRVARGAQLLGDVLIAQQPRDPRQRFQMIGARALRRQQQEHQIDRLAVHRLEIDRPIEAGKQPEQLFQLGQLAVRDGDAIPHRGGSELLPLQQDLENRAFVLPGQQRGTRRQFLQRLLLAVDFQRRENRLGCDQVGNRHWAFRGELNRQGAK